MYQRDTDHLWKLVWRTYTRGRAWLGYNCSCGGVYKRASDTQDSTDLSACGQLWGGGAGLVV